MRLILESTGGPSCGRRVVVRNGERVTFGRTDTADYAFPRDSTMSGQHFQIAVAAEGCFLTDLGSTNGTSIGGAKLAPQQPVPLRDGDCFAAGESQFRVRMEAEPSDRGGLASAGPDAGFAWPSQSDTPPPSPAPLPPAAGAAPPGGEVAAMLRTPLAPREAAAGRAGVPPGHHRAAMVGGLPGLQRTFSTAFPLPPKAAIRGSSSVAARQAKGRWARFPRPTWRCGWRPRTPSP